MVVVLAFCAWRTWSPHALVRSCLLLCRVRQAVTGCIARNQQTGLLCR